MLLADNDAFVVPRKVKLNLCFEAFRNNVILDSRQLLMTLTQLLRGLRIDLNEEVTRLKCTSRIIEPASIRSLWYMYKRYASQTLNLQYCYLSLCRTESISPPPWVS